MIRFHPVENKVEPTWRVPGRAENDADLRALVRDEYGLDLEVDASDLGGSYNLNVVATDAVSKRYVVRVYRPWVSRSRLAAIQRVKLHLRRSDVPYAEVVPSVAGRLLSSVGNRCVEVERHVETDHGMESSENLIAGVVQLAKMHNALSQFDIGSWTPAPVTNYIRGGLLVTWAQAGISTMHALGTSLKERRALLAAEQLAVYLDEVDALQLDGLPTHLTHGDYSQDNVRFRIGELAMVADFDFVDVRPRIADVATLLYSLCVSRAFHLDAESRNDMRRLVDAYDGTLKRPLSPRERCYLPYAIVRILLGFISHLGALRIDGLDEFKTRYAPQCCTVLHLARSREWREMFR